MNKARGETTITIGERTITLLPTYTCLVEYEEASGLSVFQSIDLIQKGGLPLKAISAAVRAGWIGSCKGDRKLVREVPSLEAIGDMVMAHGWPSLVPPITDWLLASVMDPSEPGKA